MRVSYLKLRHNVYWFQRRPPKKLHSVLGSKMYAINLNTTDLGIAVRKRDVILEQWAALHTTKSGREIFTHKLTDLKSRELTDSVLDLSDTVVDALAEARYDDIQQEAAPNRRQEDMDLLSGLTQKNQADFWAWQKAKNNIEPPSEFLYSLRDGLAAIVPHKKGKVSQLHLDKYPLAVDVFLGNAEDRPLETIKKGEVLRWLDKFDRSNATKNTYLSCLKGIFLYAQDRELINDQIRNPFADHKLGKSDTVHYKFMEDDLLRNIISKLMGRTYRKHRYDGLIANLARSTGVRLGELWNSNIEIHDGITCLSVFDAKTVAGIRLVPIPDRLVEAVTEAHPRWVEMGIASDYSKRFGRAKRSLVDDRSLAFHSLRVTFITWAGNTEDRWTEQHIAWLVGHEESKGDAMTGKLYFKGYNIHLMKQIVESVQPFKMPTAIESL